MPDVAGFEPGYWDALQKQARDSLLVVTAWEDACPGTGVIKAILPSMPMPVGMIWFRTGDDHTVQLLGSYVWEPLRRCGIRSAMHRQMLTCLGPSVRRITTGHSTLDGRAWLKANGFRRTSIGWALYLPDRARASE